LRKISFLVVKLEQAKATRRIDNGIKLERKEKGATMPIRIRAFPRCLVSGCVTLGQFARSSGENVVSNFQNDIFSV